MAEFDIRPGNRRHRTLSYTKKGGEAGAVQNPPEWDMSDPALATVDVDPDGMHGTVAHNGGIGDLTINSRADGDVGIGEHLIVITDVFHMLPPLDSDGGTSEVGPEEAIP